MKIKAAITALFLSWFAPTAHAAAPDAATIVTQAYEIERVEDQIAKLSFTFTLPDKSKRRVAYTMVWKNMADAGGYDSKTIFYTEYPPEKRGIAYMGWLRPAGSKQKHDEWIYLPAQRMTRRLVHREGERAHEDDEFGNSLLQRKHLNPRPPHLDRHLLIGEETLDGKPHHLVVSAPKKQAAPHHNSGKIIRWIGTEDFLTRRIQFFDTQEAQTLDMRIEWTSIGDYRVWRKVSATAPDNQAETVLEISDIKINSGLNDRLFSKRTLEKGAAHLR